jgi:hypothetical protein
MPNSGCFSECYYKGRGRRDNELLREEVAGMIQEVIREYPTYGYRRVWAILRFDKGVSVNRKNDPLRGYPCGSRPKGKNRSLFPQPEMVY